MAIAVQGEAHRGVPGPGGDLLGAGPGGDPQGDRRVPQVMDAQPLQAGGPGRGTPYPRAEARGAQRGAVGEGEHEAIRLDRTVSKTFLQRFDHRRLDARARLGERVAVSLPSFVLHPGGSALDRTHWLFPVLTVDRAGMVASLRRAGFDAATATSSIAAIAPPPDRPELAPHAAQRMIDRAVFLPVYPELGERDVERLLTAVAQAEDRAG